MLHTCAILRGDDAILNEFEVKSHNEIADIAHGTQSAFLLYHNVLSQMAFSFYSRDYVKTIELVEQIPQSNTKRVLDAVLCFYKGIASLCLARQTGEQKFRRVGEKSLEEMFKWESVSSWNFQHKRILLQSELQYLDGEIIAAEDSHKAAIVSAQSSKFLNELALAHELYGIFCLENKKNELAKEQLQMAADKYEQWGAVTKMTEVQQMKDLVDISLKY